MTFAYPLNGAWTETDLEVLPDDNRRRELVEGSLILRPSPSASHQVVTMRLMVALDNVAPVGFHVTQGVQVRLTPETVLIPDVLITSGEDPPGDRTSFAASEVTAAIEVVTERSRALDEVMKPALYAKAGIPFYWMIELDGGITVHTYKLEFTDEVYQPSGTFTDVIKIDEPWRIEIDIASLRPRNM
jgi:Uma2 family endonuclease